MAETNGNPVVVTAKLTKVFRDFWLREKVTAVADLDLRIVPREVFGLLGPNGSGKSTTLKMILGLMFPTRGRVWVFEKPPADVAVKARIGFLPEETYLYPFLDARETLDFYGRLFHQPRRERRRRTDMLLDMVGLAGVAYRRIGEYSKGMQRRIGLAQALINDPDLLILDEPTSGMDPLGTRQFKDLIRMLAQRGKTVLLSSHLLADVEDVCDRVCILYGGRQRAIGTIDELLTRLSSTQITTGPVDEATLERVRRELSAAGGPGGGEVEIRHPRERLESLFLRIVQEAARQRVGTGGVVAGGAVAEFLRPRAAEGRELIERLVSAPGAERVVPPSPEPPTGPEPREGEKKVLKELLAPLAEPRGPSPPPGPAPETPPAADRKVLDSLLTPRKPPPDEKGG